MRTSKGLAILLIFGGVVGLYLLKEFLPVVRLLAASLGMIGVIKIAALIWQVADGGKFQSRVGLLLYLFAWPGISIEGFTKRTAIVSTAGSRFLESWLTFLAGLVILVSMSLIGHGSSTALNYVSLFSILLIIHLGLIEVIADGLRLLGFSPRSLFDRPFLANSLRDFWSIRWNRAFVDMNKIFVLRPLRDFFTPAILTFSIFAISGLLHELGISYTDGVSGGSPVAYFIIQGVGMELEKHRKFPRAIVWAWILLPVLLLFTPSFTNLFLGNLSRTISDFVFNSKVEEVYKYGLIAGGLSHLLVLCASLQVPGKLGWHNEFEKLTSLNRKIFWTYGGYIFSIIVFMSVSSFILSFQDFRSLDVSVLLWTVLISLFWWARVLTDFFYMKHSDWPQGPLFSIGHICLSTLFISMASLYTILSFIVYKAIP